MDPKRSKHERTVLRKKYGALYAAVSAVLFEADPIGINFDTNTDEYEPEVGTILPRLGVAKTVQDVEAIVYEEFCRWFGVEEAGSKDSYQAVAAKIWEAWCAFNQPRG